MTTRIAASRLDARTPRAKYKEKERLLTVLPSVSENVSGKVKYHHSWRVSVARALEFALLLLPKSQEEGKGIANKTASLS